jgi:hypothetical protein
MTTTGLTRTLLAEPFTLKSTRRATIAIRERRRIAEYRRTEACIPHPFVGSEEAPH